MAATGLLNAQPHQEEEAPSKPEGKAACDPNEEVRSGSNPEPEPAPAYDPAYVDRAAAPGAGVNTYTRLAEILLSGERSPADDPNDASSSPEPEPSYTLSGSKPAYDRNDSSPVSDLTHGGEDTPDDSEQEPEATPDEEAPSTGVSNPDPGPAPGSNDVPTHPKPKPKLSPAYNDAYTEHVVAATGPNANARLAEIMPSLVRHLHAFVREVNLTAPEWELAVDFINEAGKMSDSKRNETTLVHGILGLESLVDEITSLQNPTASTPSAILGPFYRPSAPILPLGSSIVSPSSSPAYDSALTHFSGRVLDTRGDPVPDALLDVWHSAPNGLYEQQDPSQPDYNLRGRFLTDTDGRFELYCLRPTAYPIPDDGPAGRLLALLDRHPWRPSHIHLKISAEGYAPLTTQVFDAECKYLIDDAVFAVKSDLVARFAPREGDPKARWTLEYDFVLSEA
ncbi:related to hydroxyquinol-1,2-dioxygenase [Cephalotrichum gorgonifer]|uniref:Related to hydroxyquinol-1,2-dioxygenase n=1 Tax=Cephalotrichum gorgonifer TaxID=2041049 RepID=A0AAE8MWY0_9PEZI|nr:related to hydroxyquinol-1,2-dioxygenase [Cephalotrichum gorgonifer]